MNKQAEILIFGEVLFDCFPTGEQVPGGAPFNVAWHLQALGESPRLISRVGADQLGDSILQMMRDWGLTITEVQIDSDHPTGQVKVIITDGEPSYDIVANSAFDFISAKQIGQASDNTILYHGTLCLRNAPSRSALEEIKRNHQSKVFLDVNLRYPWWHQDDVCNWLKDATWAKMNQDELCQLSSQPSTIEQQMTELQETYQLEQLIVTRGEQGALIRTAAGEFYSRQPEKATKMVDTVGAGDAFSAVYIHGLGNNWPIDKILIQAQKFAAKIISIRGATPSDPIFYQQFISTLDA